MIKNPIVGNFNSELKPILEMKNVTIQFDQDIILKDITFNVLKGEIIVIVGVSGSGKTVLLKTLAGLYKPFQGQVLCEGEDWQTLKTEEKRQLAKHIGVQFQKSALFDSLSVFENVAFPLKEHQALDEKEIPIRVEECLKSVGLWEARNMMPHELSGGMKQRLGIARAIALRPEILFFDDPTAGLDPINSDKMADLIMDLKTKYSSTIVMVTHDIYRAYQMAGRIFLVANKNVIETGSAEQTKNHTDPRVQQFIHGWLKGPLDFS